MMAGHRDFDDIHDLVGVRVLVESQPRLLCRARGAACAVEADRRAVQGLHRHAEVQYVPVPAHDRDRPVAGGPWRSRSARTPCTGVPNTAWPPTGSTRRTAATGKNSRRDDPPTSDMAWLRQLLDWQKETEDPTEFLESLRYEMSARGLCLHPEGRCHRPCPPARPPIDFAYAVHTEVGHRCVGARVNGRLVSLESPLENGDVVEVLTSKAEGAGPSRDWLNIVTRRGPATRSASGSPSLAARKPSRPAGRDRQGDAQAAPARCSGMMSHQIPRRGRGGVAYADVDALYAAVGDNHVSASEHVVSRSTRSAATRAPRRTSPSPSASVVRPGAAPASPASSSGMGREVFVKLASLLHPGSRRRDPGLRHPRSRGLGAPQ
jgi:guanosine-3',5'-bis(diphosphate) 3'-pyrophosphohydrolase